MSIELKETRKNSQKVLHLQPLQDVFYQHTVPRARIDELVKQIQREPILNRRHLCIEFSREDQFHYSFKVTAKLLELARKYNWTEEESIYASSHIFGQYLPNHLHASAFTYVIRVIGSDQQARKWLPLCRRHEMIGCYAQTELGHGSNVQGLQTKAYYDPIKKDIAVCSNDDDISSRKWWIGGLGITADHAVVQALLYFPPDNDPACLDRSRYINLGPHLFIVPIRDPETRVPLPGVTVGDIGPKAASGFSIIDNGYLSMNNVRIPTDNMLSRFMQIDTSGARATYRLMGNPKVMYASMTNLRAGYPHIIGIPLAKAVTIASRYLTVRRQFQKVGTDGGKSAQETQVINYSTVYMRLVPYIALAHSIGFVNDALQRKFTKMMSELVENSNDTLLPEVHSLTSSLKAIISMQGTRAIEQCQILLGGHGFMHNSGLATLYGNALPAQTFEGENYVVSQQTANALAKVVDVIFTEGKEYARATVFPAAQFLIENVDRGSVDDSCYKGTSLVSPKTAKEWVHNDDYIIDLLQAKTTAAVVEYRSAMQKRPANEIKHLAAAVGFAFGHQFLVTEYLYGASTLKFSNPESLALVQSLARTAALQHILENVGFLVEHSLIQGHSIGPLRSALEAEILKIRPHVVMLTDTFGFSDYELDTTLGNYDGEPYKHLVSRSGSLNNGDFTRDVQKLRLAAGGRRTKI